MNPFQLLIDAAAEIIDLSRQLNEQPAQTIQPLAEQVGLDPAMVLWLLTTLANLKRREPPSVFVVSVERMGTSDADSIIVAFTEETLNAALAEEQIIFLNGPDNREITPEEIADDDRIVTHHGEIFIR